MSAKKPILIVDSESTIEGHAADFAAVLVDRQGRIIKQMAVLIADFYCTEELYHDKKANDIWGYAGLERRKAQYIQMLETGSRTLASINAVNRWLDRVIAAYPQTSLTAYNLAFDVGICKDSGIDLSAYTDRFCLWHLACGHFAHTKEYRQYILENAAFNPRTEKGNLSFKSNAEVMGSFVQNLPLQEEPHTSLEDILNFEKPILDAIMKRKKWRERSKVYNWRDFQVKDHFVPK